VIFKSIADEGRLASGLLPALALSCVLHVLLLWPDALPRMAQQAGQPLTATLRTSAVGHSRAQTAPISPTAQYKPAAKTAPRQRVTAKSEPEPATLAPPSAAEGTHVSGPAIFDTASVGSDMGNQNRNPVAQEGPASRPDADGIRAYRIGLAREARAHRQYPYLARERGWTGTAEVRVDVSHDGHPRQVLLASSSGHDILDREAVHMMSRAAASAVLPDSLRGRAFAVRLPVVFDIPEVR
jgi:protein TonB